MAFLNPTLCSFAIRNQVCQQPNPIPKPYLFGHNCYFKRNLSEYMYWQSSYSILQEYIMSEADLTATKEERVMKFMSDNTPPYIVNVRDEDGFIASNPMFSLLYETALKYNYT